MLENLIRRLRLPPDYSIDYYENKEQGLWIVCLVHRVPDVLKSRVFRDDVPLGMVDVLGKVVLSRLSDEDEWVHLIWLKLREMAVHEVNEWFTVEGKHYVEPHPELKTSA